MFPLTPDQHHWLEVATEDEGWLMTDYPCGKFGDCSFSSFGSVVRTDTHRQTSYVLLPRLTSAWLMVVTELSVLSSDVKTVSSPVSIQTQSLALASSQSWLPLLRPSIPIGWRLRLLRESKRLRFLRFSFTQRKALRLNGNRASVTVWSWVELSAVWWWCSRYRRSQHSGGLW